VSGSDQEMDAKRMGAIGFLLKPVSMSELSDAFKKIEQFAAKSLKKLLILSDSAQRQAQLQELIKEMSVTSTQVSTREAALTVLQTQNMDCLIIDADVEQHQGTLFLETLYMDDVLSQIPVILYTDRELSHDEEMIASRCAENVTIKSVSSPERLLDEATLFLHQLESSLSKEKRSMLRMVHDKEAILAGKKVLIVDDDMRNTFALATILEEKNMEVIVAKNGKEALRSLEQQVNISIILMDIMMPEMDGYEAMTHIRAQERFRKLPIIALTAKAMKGDKAKCIEAGANDYLAKPVDMDKLLSLMRVWLYR
jgi:CheY-like chemotaxis protein